MERKDEVIAAICARTQKCMNGSSWKAPPKNKCEPKGRTLWSGKQYFLLQGAPSLERRLNYSFYVTVSGPRYLSLQYLSLWSLGPPVFASPGLSVLWSLGPLVLGSPVLGCLGPTVDGLCFGFLMASPHCGQFYLL